MSHVNVDLIFACIRLPCMLMLIKGVRMGENGVSSCYGDVCNVGNVSQFCSETFKFCRDCEEIRDDCGTFKQPWECTGYCIDLGVKNALAKKEINDAVCHLVSVMMNIDNGKVHAPLRERNNYFDVGSKITYSCNEGYDIQGPSELVCLGEGQWSQSKMPYCFSNSCENYKVYRLATIVLSVITSCLVIAVFICSCHKRREGKETSRNSSQQSMQDEEQPFIDNTQQETEQFRQPFSIGDTALTELSHQIEVEDDKTSVRTNQAEGHEARAEGHEANALRKDQNDPVIVIENNVNFINMPAQSPDTKNMSQNKNTNTHSDQNGTKNELKDEKLSTEETGEKHPFEETAEPKTFKGTKPLPARNEKLEELKKSVDVNNTDSPEVVPAEDEETKLSKYETNQGQTKKLGMQDRTFAKDDIN